MEIKFKFEKYTDRDVFCPYKILFKENKWYKSWNYLLTETVGGGVTHFVCKDIERCNEVVNEIGNPFEHNERVTQKSLGAPTEVVKTCL